MNVKKKGHRAFTLIEMLVVLLVIAVLVLLFVPNVIGQRKKINEEGKASFEQVIQTQAELFLLDEPGDPTTVSLEDLEKANYLTEKQVKQAVDKYKYDKTANLKGK